MSIIERVIDVFEKRVSDLEKIRYLPDLPQWTDADIIGAGCLIEQYRNLTSRRSRAAEACGNSLSCLNATPACTIPCPKYQPPPA